MFKSLPVNPHTKELIGGLLDAVKLELTIQEMKSHPREEDVSKFYASQSTLDEKCQALSAMAETKRSELKFCDYLDSLVAWSKEAADVTSQYMDARVHKNPLDFQTYLRRPGGNDPLLSMEHFALWIRHLEKRITISQQYLKMISRKPATSAMGIVSNGHSVTSQTGAPSTSKGPSECSELLQRVEEFHDSHEATHIAPMNEVQGILEKAQTRPNIPVGVAQVLKTEVLAEACCIEVQNIAITEAFCGEMLLQMCLFTMEAYEKAWEAIQTVIDIVESITRMSIRMQMQGLRRN